MERSKTSRFDKIRTSRMANILFTFLVPLILLVTLEWVARGTLAGNKQGNGFIQSIGHHFMSFFVAYLLLLFLYIFISQLAGRHWPATLLVGLAGYLPAVVTHYKLTMRGEPFLPWDLSQIGDLMEIQSEVKFTLSFPIILTGILFILLIVISVFVRMPEAGSPRKRLYFRLASCGLSVVMVITLFSAVFLNPAGTAAIGIKEDMWMQDRYYRTNGVLTGFLTNLQMLNIQRPEGYSAEAVAEIAQQSHELYGDSAPYFANSPAAKEEQPQQPDIIFLMAESFWDVTALEGVQYDREILTNLLRLAEEGGYGKLYTPSFGGGTCDVEFEALTGFSVEFLPSGSKPFQQYVTDDLFSLPQYLKSSGYSTLAIHGYGKRFWNRDVAYPRLGIDTFIAEEDFENPGRRRGFISDDTMVERIIEEYENREGDSPQFIHAVTMQNHTTYSRDRYPAQDLVNVTYAPPGLNDSTIGQLEDCATGIYEMDRALGKLTDYLKTSDRPTILVFWGDHMNPMTGGYSLFEETGFIEEGDTGSPNLHQTPLLIWSNYSDAAIDLGVLGAYLITPAMLDIYGLEKPVMFEYLAGQLGILRARSHGFTVDPDGGITTEMTEDQQKSFDQQGILQYDYLFGEKTLEDYVGEAPPS